MLIVADVLYYYVVMTAAERDALKLPNDSLQPGFLPVPAARVAEITRAA